jgi:hypothetical protein
VKRVTGKHVYLSLLMVFCEEEYNNCFLMLILSCCCCLHLGGFPLFLGNF